MVTVEFINVGSHDKCWTATLAGLNYDTLFKEVRSKHALYSRNIDFLFDEQTQRGVVVVGEVRTVGEFKVVTDVSEEQFTGAEKS